MTRLVLYVLTACVPFDGGYPGDEPATPDPSIPVIRGGAQWAR